MKEKKKKVPGKFSIQENKLRIENSDGQTSVLFEDISSITWRKEDRQNTELGLFGIYVGVFGGMFSMFFWDNNIIPIIFLIIGILIAIIGFLDIQYWDDVIVETRGGLLVKYSVEANQGQKNIDQIEEAKRNLLYQ